VTGANKKHVAHVHSHPLVALRRLQVLAEHMLTRLDPGHPANARNVEQNAAANEPVLEDGDRARLGALRGS
jgi:hypothetical protein